MARFPVPPQQDKSLHVASLFVPEIKELLTTRDFLGVKRLFKTISCLDLASEWKYFTPAEKTLLFRLLSARDASTLFEELDP